MLRSVQSAGDVTRCTLDYDTYFRVSRLLHKAMIEEWDEEDANACAAEDWVTDSAGKAFICEERFKDCMFELADICEQHATPICEPHLQQPLTGCTAFGY